MLPETGLYLLILATIIAIIQGSLPIIGIYKGFSICIAVAKPAALCQLACILLSFLCLEYAFVTNDFSVLHVYQNSNSSMGLLYRITVAISYRDGTVLVWVLLLAFLTVAISLFNKKLPHELLVRIIVIMAWIAIPMFIYLLMIVTPFERVYPIQTEGNSIHPLITPLFQLSQLLRIISMTGFSLIFAFSISSLMMHRLKIEWVQWLQPWIVATLVCICLSSILGNWWVYTTLGWAGWWYWDTYDNSNLMLCLVGIGLLYSTTMISKLDSQKIWIIYFGILSFILSLLSLLLNNTLISSGLIHLKLVPITYLSIFLAITSVSSSSFFAWKINKMGFKNRSSLTSLSLILSICNLLLLLAITAILLGTIYSILGDSRVKPMTLNGISMVIVFYILIGSALFLMIFTHYESSKQIKFLNCNNCRQHLTSRFIGPCCIYLGAAIFLISNTIAMNFRENKELLMEVGDSTELASYTLRFDGITKFKNIDTITNSGKFHITRSNIYITTLFPKNKNIEKRNNGIPYPAIHSRLTYDLYITLGEQNSNSSWNIRIYYIPLMNWIWVGAFMTILGVILTTYSSNPLRIFHPEKRDSYQN